MTSARVSEPYAFRPTAADADGDRLTFSIQRKPAWATFDATDGTLYGTPAATDVGTASNVVIGVSDGQATATLPAFSVSVSPPPTLSVSLSWRAPTSNVDGSPLTDLAGYRVYYGTASGQYSYNLPVASQGVTSVVIEGLSSSTTWYFAVKGVTTSGVESDYSQEASKSL